MADEQSKPEVFILSLRESEDYIPIILLHDGPISAAEFERVARMAIASVTERMMASSRGCIWVSAVFDELFATSGFCKETGRYAPRVLCEEAVGVFAAHGFRVARQAEYEIQDDSSPWDDELARHVAAHNEARWREIGAAEGEHG